MEDVTKKIYVANLQRPVGFTTQYIFGFHCCRFTETCLYAIPYQTLIKSNHSFHGWIFFYFCYYRPWRSRFKDGVCAYQSNNILCTSFNFFVFTFFLLGKWETAILWFLSTFFSRLNNIYFKIFSDFVNTIFI